MKGVSMKNNGSFVTQAAILAGAGLFVRLLGFVSRLVMTNVLLGDLGNDIYGVAYIVYGFFFIVSSAGLPAAVSKMVAERYSVGRYAAAHRVFRVSMLFACIMGVLCMALMLFCAAPVLSYINSPKSLLSVQVLVPSIMVVAVMAVFRGYFQGMGSTVPTAISQVIEGVFNTIASIALAYLWMTSTGEGVDALPYAAAGASAGTTVSTVVGLLVMVWFYYMLKPRLLDNIKNAPKEKKKADTGDLFKEITRITFPIIAGTAIMSISNMIDTGMVKNLLEAAKVWTEEEINSMNGILQGKFFTITTLPVSISTALATAVIPSIAASVVRKEKAVVRQKINMSLRIAMLISMPSAMGIGLLADQILRMLFGAAPAGGGMLRVGALSIVFLALTQILTGTLQGIGKVQIPMFGVLLGVLVKVIMNYFLISIPAVNVNGAVISTIACYLVAGTFDWIMLTRLTKTKPDMVGILLKPAVAAVVMGMAVYVVYYLVYYILPSNTFATLLAIVAGMGIYFGILLLIGGLKRGDIAMLPGGKKLAAALERRGILKA